VGAVLNANWAQMADFGLGWVGIDFAGDDGRKLGLWPWQADAAAADRRPEPPTPPEETRPETRQGRPTPPPPPPQDRRNPATRLDAQP